MGVHLNIDRSEDTVALERRLVDDNKVISKGAAGRKTGVVAGPAGSEACVERSLDDDHAYDGVDVLVLDLIGLANDMILSAWGLNGDTIKTLLLTQS